MKKIIVLKDENDITGVKRIKTPTWRKHRSMKKTRTDFLKEKGVNVDALMYLTPAERTIEANKLLANTFSDTGITAAEATITPLEEIRNQTQRNLFDITFFDKDGDCILYGKYNQKLNIRIDLLPVEVKPDMVQWDNEKQFIFVNEIFENQLVHRRSVTPYGSSCYSLAIGCKLEDGLLKVGKNADFRFNGKKVSLEYYFHFNNTMGNNLTVPSDMDVLQFNFHHYQWHTLLAEGEYTRKNTVSVAKTDNNNYVLLQNNPRRAMVVLSNGDIVRNDIASYGNARLIQTSILSLDDYADAIKEYNNIVILEQEKKEKQLQEKLSEMYAEKKGWYIVELPCFQNDFIKGGHKKRFTNWKVLANSEIHAYNTAVSSAEEKGYFWFAEPTDCQIDFFGVWNDDKEEMLMNEGLI